MQNRLDLNYRLVGLVALAQPLLLLSLGSPSQSQQAIEVMKEKEKIEQQVDKDAEKIAALKAKDAGELVKIKEKEAANLAKIAAHGHHSPPAPTPPAPAPSPVSQSGPNVDGVPMFPGSIFNTDISNMPVDPNSVNWLAHISGGGAAGAILYRTFGGCFVNSTTNGHNVISGYPVNIVGQSQAKVPFVATEYASECDPGPIPMPANGAVEGSVCPGGPVSVSIGDCHSMLVQTGTKNVANLWELYSWNSTGNYSPKNANGSWGGFMASWDTHSNQMRPSGWTSANAGGLPITPLLVRYEEVKAGAINHALYASINWVTDNACVWPASHTISSGPNDPTDYPPMGACLRLHANFDVSSFNPACQVVLNALKKYGMYVMDINGGGNLCTLQGEFNQNWTPYGGSTPPGDMSQLGNVKMTNFDYVDLSSLMVSPTSYEAATGSTNSISGATAGSGGSIGSGSASGIQIRHTETGPRNP